MHMTRTLDLICRSPNNVLLAGLVGLGGCESQACIGSGRICRETNSLGGCEAVEPLVGPGLLRVEYEAADRLDYVLELGGTFSNAGAVEDCRFAIYVLDRPPAASSIAPLRLEAAASEIDGSAPVFETILPAKRDGLVFEREVADLVTEQRLDVPAGPGDDTQWLLLLPCEAPEIEYRLELQTFACALGNDREAADLRVVPEDL